MCDYVAKYQVGEQICSVEILHCCNSLDGSTNASGSGEIIRSRALLKFSPEFFVFSLAYDLVPGKV